MKKNTTKQLLTFVIMLTACITLTACDVKSEDKHAQKSDSKVSEKIQDKEDKITSSKDTVNSNDITKTIDKDNAKRKDKVGISDKSINEENETLEEDSEPTESSTEATGDTIETVDISEVDKDKLQQALNTYKFSLNDSSLDMSTHIKLSDLENLGYSLKDFSDTDTEIESHKYSLTSVKMEHENGSVINITVCNPSDNTIKFKDADIYTIEIKHYDEDKYPGYNPNFYIESAEAVKLNLITLEQFDELTLGMENIDVYDGDNYSSRTVYTQSENYYSRNKYAFTFIDGVLNSIKITYM